MQDIFLIDLDYKKYIFSAKDQKDADKYIKDLIKSGFLSFGDRLPENDSSEEGE